MIGKKDMPAWVNTATYYKAMTTNKNVNKTTYILMIIICVIMFKSKRVTKQIHTHTHAQFAPGHSLHFTRE